MSGGRVLLTLPAVPLSRVSGPTSRRRHHSHSLFVPCGTLADDRQHQSSRMVMASQNEQNSLPSAWPEAMKVIPPGWSRGPGGELWKFQVRATWFGGPRDPGDSGETASGVNTARNPEVLGIALPVPTSHATRRSGWPVLPYGTHVEVRRAGLDEYVSVALLDVGPATDNPQRAEADITPAVAVELGYAVERYRPLQGLFLLDVRIHVGVFSPLWGQYRRLARSTFGVRE